LVSASDAPAVVLLHGLYLSVPYLVPLQRRIERCGFKVRRFSYPSVRGSVRENAARAAAQVCAFVDTGRFISPLNTASGSDRRRRR